jgi:hypothetical protein
LKNYEANSSSTEETVTEEREKEENIMDHQDSSKIMQITNILSKTHHKVLLEKIVTRLSTATDVANQVMFRKDVE